ncbi:VrlE [Myxococcus llanfairpwllgwyngyllgogerychwyrndrobwllllantysiliogogogochensis]|uniref:VrlE n=1 Tax=Myxococcus llanfairpwllgwyngyllgogerychwyrndrobwllllantysiliogogogochensis TaxID=2590453 RepID=A0A540WJH4_9BACT|nr:amidoligase family protein [Myxococcus llanfairpwllgwyngyllgogerychwyrndrobwllllantysiliogogogochensis]TQF09172.1 VrlE [Myxococcus llanfairpwllgwyngyllgogerychwyrndrobwllllantysiliogogogochensis]
MKTLRFGIEIETVGASRQKLAHAIQGAVGGRVSGDYQGWQVTDSQGRTWKVVPDGSLSGGEYSGEIVSPILTYQDMEALQQVVRAAREAGARADASTGIHIHVDGSRFDAKGVTNLVKMVHKQERLLETALGVSAARLNRFCKPIDGAFLQRLEARRPRTLQDVNEAWYGRRNLAPQRYDASRYHGLNLNSLFFRGTIEFRYFNGSVHAGEVKAYVQLVLALAARALASKAASSKRRDFNPATAKYDFRVFLLHLGLIGEEFKTARTHLLKKLEGSAAWKGQRRDRRGSGGEGTPGSEGAQGGSEGAQGGGEGAQGNAHEALAA